MSGHRTQLYFTMAHIKTNSFGYTSKLLRAFPKVTLQLNEQQDCIIYPHEDRDPDLLPLFDMEIRDREDDRTLKAWDGITFNQVKERLDILEGCYV